MSAFGNRVNSATPARISTTNAPLTAEELALLPRVVRYRLACEFKLDVQRPDFLELSRERQGELLASALERHGAGAS